MQYVPCADSAFRRTRYYCCSDDDCFRIFKQKGGCRETYDGRDGITCSIVTVACPC